MSASFESRYRRALRWYPKRWRRQHEEAMLGILLEMADDSIRSNHTGRPDARRAELRALRIGALRAHLDEHLPKAAREIGSGLSLATGFALSVLYLLFQLGLPSSAPGSGGPGVLGHPEFLFAVLWGIAVAGVFVHRRVLVRSALALVVVASVVLLLMNHLGLPPWRGPSGSTLVFSAAFATVALIAPPRRSRRFLIAVVGAALASIGIYLRVGGITITFAGFAIGVLLPFVVVVLMILRRTTVARGLVLAALPWAVATAATIAGLAGLGDLALAAPSIATVVGLYLLAIVLVGVVGAIMNPPNTRFTGLVARAVRTPLRKSVLLTVVVGAIVAVATTGFTSQSPIPTPPGPKAAFAGQVPPQADPLRDYAQNPEVIVAVTRAEDILASACMKTFGFGYQAQDYDTLAQSFVEADSRLYGITDPAAAAVYGFLPAPTVMQVRPAEETTPLYQLALTGLKPGQNPTEVSPSKSPGTVSGRAVPPSGCLGQARLTLTGVANGGPPEEATLGQDLDGKAWVDALNDPASVAARADWSGCMADAGYSMKDPLEDIPDPQGSTGTPAEIKQALADISCKGSTGYIARVNAENVRVAEEYLEQNRTALQASKAFNDNALKNANEVIAAG
jgi:hypothetical protein